MVDLTQFTERLLPCRVTWSFRVFLKQVVRRQQLFIEELNRALTRNQAPLTSGPDFKVETASSRLSSTAEVGYGGLVCQALSCF